MTNVPTDEVQVYDLETQQWSMASPLPNPRGGHVAVLLEDKVHVLGDGNSVSTIADHSQYDSETDTWKELAPLPRAEGSPAAAVVDGKIHVIGGRSRFVHGLCLHRGGSTALASSHAPIGTASVQRFTQSGCA